MLLYSGGCGSGSPLLTLAVGGQSGGGRRRGSRTDNKDSSAMDDDSNDRLRAASTLKMPILNVSLLQERGYTEKSKALPNARKGFALALQKEKRVY